MLVADFWMRILDSYSFFISDTLSLMALGTVQYNEEILLAEKEIV